MTSVELMIIGERIDNVMKSSNLREGMMRKDVHPTDRFFEPIKSGPGRGEYLDSERYDRMPKEYDMLRGWNIETGRLTQRNLGELGLTEVANELEKMGKVKRPSHLQTER